MTNTSQKVSDLALCCLAERELELEERVTTLEHEQFWFREIAVVAIHNLHAARLREDRLRTQLSDIAERRRAIRETP